MTSLEQLREDLLAVGAQSRGLGLGAASGSACGRSLMQLVNSGGSLATITGSLWPCWAAWAAWSLAATYIQ